MRTFAVLLDLMTVVYLTRYSLKPMRLLRRPRRLAGLTGVAFGIAAIAMKVFADFHLNANPLLYASLFGIMIGLQFILMGMTAEMHTRTHYESQGRRPYAISQLRGFPQTVGTLSRAA